MKKTLYFSIFALILMIPLIASSQTQVNLNSFLIHEQAGVPYQEFIDGTPAVSGDNNAENYDLPFTFAYAGMEFNHVRICTNGWIGLGDDISHAAYENDLSSTDYFRLLAPCWDRLTINPNFGGEISYKTEGDAPDQVFIIQFKNASTVMGLLQGESINFQVRLHENNGVISYAYGSMNAVATYWSASIGMIGNSGGVNDFISISPGNPSTYSSTIAKNNIDTVGLYDLTNKEFTFLPEGTFVALSSPENNEITETAVSLIWEDFFGRISYQLQVSTSPDFFTTVVEESDIIGTSFDIPALEPLSQYYWRVRALLEDEEYSYWSRVWSFATTGDLPAPSLLSPENAITDLFPSIKLEWEESIFATEFYLQVATDMEFTQLIVEQTGIESNSFNLEGLNLSTQYYWRVQMSNQFSISPWSEVWEFATGPYIIIGEGESYYEGNVYPAPYGATNRGAKHQILILAEEIYNAGGASGDLISLAFNIAELKSTIGLVNFEIKLKQTEIDNLDEEWDTDGFTSVFQNSSLVNVADWNIHEFNVPFPWDGTSNILVDVCFNNPLMAFDQNNTCYSTTMNSSVRWYTANNATVCTAPGAATLSSERPNIMFGIELRSISPPTNLMPENGAYGVSGTPLLEFTSVEGAASYGIMLATDPDYNEIILDEEGLEYNQYQVPAGLLLPLTTYYWRSNASDGNSLSSWSASWSFTVAGDLFPPYLAQPNNELKGAHPNVAFEWEGSLGAAEYQIQVATDYGFSELIIDENTATTDFTYELEINSHYYWRVMAINPSSESPWSEIWEFTTGYTFVIGDGTSTNSIISYPAPYGTVSFGAKHQFLIHSDELYDAGALPGNLASLSFDVSQLNSSIALSDLEIKLKNTDATELDASWDFGGFTTVYYCSSYLNTLDWNTHLFNSSFYWDGSSNILVDICFNNSESGGLNQRTRYTTTSFNSVRYFRDNTLNVCSSPGAVSLSNRRHNMMFSIEADEFQPPQNLSPENEATGISQLPLFEWSEVEGASSYSLMVATDPDFENIVIFEEGLLETEYQVPASYELAPSTVHYWKANATDGEQTSPWSYVWSFTTGGDLPSPTLSSPPNYASEIPTSVKFEWEPQVAAENYQLQIARNEEFSNIVYDQMLTVSQVTVGLERYSSYYWRVKAFNPSSESDWSELWHFTTGSLFIIGEGTTYNSNSSYPAPYGNLYYGAKHQILIHADEIYDAGGLPGALTSLAFNIHQLGTGTVFNDFRIRMVPIMQNELDENWDENDFTELYYNPSLQTNDIGWFTHTFDEPFVWDGASNILVDICFNNSSATLNHSTYYTQTSYNSVRYYRADNSTVCTAFGTATLSNLRPNMMFDLDVYSSGRPYNLLPENGELSVSQTPFFDWTDVEFATSYGLVVATDPNFNNIIINETGLSESEYQVPESNELAPATTHYWKANAFDEGYPGSWSEVWSFTTGVDYLTEPALIAPQNYATNVPAGVRFEWEEVVGAEYYQIQVASDEDFYNIVNEQDLYRKFCNLALAMNSTFYWQVRALNDNLIGPWSEIWEFTTGPYIVLGEGESYYDGNVYPAPYGATTRGAKHQLLVLAEEIYNAGGGPGDLTSLAFNIPELVSVLGLVNFEIKLKQTDINNLGEEWDSEGFTSVFQNSSLVNVANWNIHEFNNPFPWDGASNILVDVCFNNPLMAFAHNHTYYSTTMHSSVRWYAANNATVCTAPGTANLTWERPNMMFGIEISDLLAPVNISPINGSYGVSETPLLDFSSVDGAISYGIMVAEDPDFTYIVIEESELNESEYQVQEGILLPLTTYYWRANASDGNALSPWSTSWSFTVAGDLLAPNLLQPANGLVGTPPNVFFQWEASLGAAEYEIQVATDSDFSGIIIDEEISSTDFEIELETNSHYYWRVRASNPYSISPWSEIWELSTGYNAIIGEGTSLSHMIRYPSPYGSIFNGAKHQILVLADELNDAEVYGAYISSLAFNVGEINSALPLTNFEIKLKHTNATVLDANWDEEGFTSVYLCPSYNNVLGWNVHLFNEPFVCDGGSNILIDICFNNSESGGMNQRTYYTTTAFTSVRHYAANSSTVCTEPGAASISSNRPNIMFSVEAFTGLPQNLLPEKGAIDVVLNPLFDWTDVEGAISYGLMVATDPDFENIVIFEEGLLETEYQVPDGDRLAPSTVYYWRANANDGNETSFWSPRWSFTTLELPALDQVALAQPEDGLTDTQVDNLPMSWNSVQGANYYTFQINDSEDFSEVLLSQDFTVRSLLVSGFAYATTYYWRVMAKSNEGNIGPWSEIWSFTTIAEPALQEIAINSGWNIISSYVNPDDPDMIELFEDALNNINVVKNGAGQMFIPQQEINNIGDWSIADGYLINANSSFNLAIEGIKVIPEETPLALDGGWNLVPYLRTSALSTNLALATISDEITLAKNNSGGIYFPAWGVNTVGNMLSGQGYWIYTNQAGVLTYPENSAGKIVTDIELSPLAKQLVPIYKNTGNNATLLLQFDGIENGAEVGVYNVNDELIGSGAVHNGVSALTIWGDDELTKQVDGAAHSELLSVKLLSNNALQNVSLYNIKEITKDIEQDNLIYSTNAIYLAKATVLNNDELAFSISCVPNPAANSTTFEFSLADEGDAVIEIYTLNGELIAKVGNNYYTPGVHKLNFDLSNLLNGVYNVVLNSLSKRASSLMIINK